MITFRDLEVGAHVIKAGEIAGKKAGYVMQCLNEEGHGAASKGPTIRNVVPCGRSIVLPPVASTLDRHMCKLLLCTRIEVFGLLLNPPH